MKLKYCLIGMGMGIILSTIVFAIGVFASNVNTELKTIPGETASGDSVIAYTTKSSQTSREENDKSGEELSEASGGGTKESTKNTDSGKNVSGNLTAKETVYDNNTGNNPYTENTTAEDDGYAEVEIDAGFTASHTADVLMEKGVIDRKDEFVEYARVTGNSVKIRTGIYRIKKGETVENIMKMITSEN